MFLLLSEVAVCVCVVLVHFWISYSYGIFIRQYVRIEIVSIVSHRKWHIHMHTLTHSLNYTHKHEHANWNCHESNDIVRANKQRVCSFFVCNIQIIEAWTHLSRSFHWQIAIRYDKLNTSFMRCPVFAFQYSFVSTKKAAKIFDTVASTLQLHWESLVRTSFVLSSSVSFDALFFSFCFSHTIFVAFCCCICTSDTPSNDDVKCQRTTI